MASLNIAQKVFIKSCCYHTNWNKISKISKTGTENNNENSFLGYNGLIVLQKYLQLYRFNRKQ